MSLALRKDSKWWYGKYVVGGREFCKNLRVEVRGERPRKLSQVGSVAFEQSRGEAKAALDRLRKEIETGRTNEELAQAVYQARTGYRLERHKLAELPGMWLKIPRRRPPAPKYAEDSVAMLGRFVEFVGSRAVYVDQVRTSHVTAFMESLDALGMTNSRWNKYLELIRSMLRRCGVMVAADLVSRDEETVFREPFSVEELQAIFAAAWESDRMIYSIAVTAACTAMRKKDCCHLRWADVDLESGFVTVKTSKTRVTVDIPIADMLREEIERHQGEDDVYVFPEARFQYFVNDSTLSRRLKAVLKLAGFDAGKEPDTECRTDGYDPADLRAVAERVYSGDQLGKVLAVLDVYLSGKSVRETAVEIGAAQSTVSLYLNTLEKEAGIRFIRGKRREAGGRKTEDSGQPRRGEINRKREKGIQAASVRDFHSFRTTFVTLAMTNGMPIDTVRLITGHRTAEIVTRHYFRPQREAIRQAMRATLPGLLSIGKGAGVATDAMKLEAVRELLRGQTAKNWRKLRDEALAVMG